MNFPVRAMGAGFKHKKVGCDCCSENKFCIFYFRIFFFSKLSKFLINKLNKTIFIATIDPWGNSELTSFSASTDH